MSLRRFGQKLRELRKNKGLTQAELARQVPVSSELISIWERAYQHRERRWKPDRPSVLRLVEIFADQLQPEEAQSWVALVDYKLGQTELQKIFSADLAQPTTPAAPVPDFQANLKRLELPPEQQLFGVRQEQAQLRDLIEQTKAPWIVVIDGIGGIGKTSLANGLVHEIMPTDRFYDIAWVSAQQEEFLPSTGLRPIECPALDVDTLTDTLLEQLHSTLPLSYSAEEKLAILSSLLKQQAYLIVIDNLETVVDYEALLPLLRKVAKPSKFLLTSRHHLYAHSDVFCLSLKELNQADTIALLKYEADVRGLSALVNAPRAALGNIYEMVGGNPLALKLVIGQIGVLPLSQVLENLKEARGKKTEDLYNYIYWQAWHALDPVSREVLLVMPLVQGGTFAQLTALSQFELGELSQALEHLIALSLVEVSGDDLEQHRYRIHRLTETFLLTEVAKWQTAT
jgi:transcriptional regulator with XRE-family HTH domain